MNQLKQWNLALEENLFFLLYDSGDQRLWMESHVCLRLRVSKSEVSFIKKNSSFSGEIIPEMLRFSSNWRLCMPEDSDMSLFFFCLTVFFMGWLVAFAGILLRWAQRATWEGVVANNSTCITHPILHSGQPNSEWSLDKLQKTPLFGLQNTSSHVRWLAWDLSSHLRSPTSCHWTGRRNEGRRVVWSPNSHSNLPGIDGDSQTIGKTEGAVFWWFFWQIQKPFQFKTRQEYPICLCSSGNLKPQPAHFLQTLSLENLTILKVRLGNMCHVLWHYPNTSPGDAFNSSMRSPIDYC